MAWTFGEPMNGRSFEHHGRYGCKLVASRCDFSEGARFEYHPDTTEEQRLADMAICIGFHATVVLPELNGFQGYDAISWQVVDSK